LKTYLHKPEKIDNVSDGFLEDLIERSMLKTHSDGSDSSQSDHIG